MTSLGEEVDSGLCTKEKKKAFGSNFFPFFLKVEEKTHREGIYRLWSFHHLVSTD